MLNEHITVKTGDCETIITDITEVWTFLKKKNMYYQVKLDIENGKKLRKGVIADIFDGDWFRKRSDSGWLHIQYIKAINVE